MDVFVLLIFAGFFAGLTVATTANGGLLRASMRRARLFQVVAVAAGTVLVPLDLSVAAYGTFGGGQARLAELAAQLLLLNVAASCGIAALHGFLRRPDVSGQATEPALRLGVLGWVGPLVALVAVAGMAVLGQLRNHEGAAAVGPVWAFYSVLICVISAYALLRQRARGAIDPQEG